MQAKASRACGSASLEFCPWDKSFLKPPVFRDHNCALANVLDPSVHVLDNHLRAVSHLTNLSDVDELGVGLKPSRHSETELPCSWLWEGHIVHANCDTPETSSGNVSTRQMRWYSSRMAVPDQLGLLRSVGNDWRLVYRLVALHPYLYASSVDVANSGKGLEGGECWRGDCRKSWWVRPVPSGVGVDEERRSGQLRVRSRPNLRKATECAPRRFFIREAVCETPAENVLSLKAGIDDSLIRKTRLKYSVDGSDDVQLSRMYQVSIT
ncbi:hypothetical protein SELMODRAFT_411310 [Selaginella moellendorffii]|uniref:Uncharacterized protein n=1 Tax=Selaginella moellendorffii TaxID=88036 RepID=D8RH83_SELML|nr:hypothetical protein SELMODRAFT_411310 [Selaginella moellendorffii]